MDQQIAVILDSAELGPFESLIADLTSAVNEQRSNAESLFILGRDLHPDALALKLVAVLDASPAIGFRAMSAVHLRILLTHRDSNGLLFWLRLSPASQTSLKSLLLAVLQQEPDRSTFLKVADTISVLYLLPESTWPELLQFLFNATAASNTHPRLLESALLIFAQIGPYILSHLPILMCRLDEMLFYPSSPNIRVAALTVVVNLATSVDGMPALMEFGLISALRHAMFEAFIEFIYSGNEDYDQEAFKLLIDFASARPRYFRFRIYNQVVVRMMQKAESESEEIQHLCNRFMMKFSNTLADAELEAAEAEAAEAEAAEAEAEAD